MNEEALARVVPQCHKKKEIYLLYRYLFIFSEIYTESGYEPG